MTARLPRVDCIAIRRQEGGYCTEGPGYYVWDTDPREVASAAHELERGGLPSLPSQPVPGGPTPHDGDDAV